MTAICPRGRGEIGGVGLACDDEFAGGIDLNSRDRLVAGAAEKASPDEWRIDGKWGLVIVGGDGKVDGVAGDHIRARHLAALASDDLIGNGLAPGDAGIVRSIFHLGARRKNQIAVGGDFRGCSEDCKADVGSVGVWRELEIVFEMTLTSVVHNVDAGIERAIPNPREVRNIGQPTGAIGANQVVADALEFLFTNELGVRIGTHEAGANGARGIVVLIKTESDLLAESRREYPAPCETKATARSACPRLASKLMGALR